MKTIPKELIEELFEASVELAEELDEYDCVAQKDDFDAYGPTSCLGKLQAVLLKIDDDYKLN